MFFFVIMKKFGLKIVLLNLTCKRYVDDTFLIFCSKHHIEKFRNYLECLNKDIRFTSETLSENSILFLDIKISRDNIKFTISINRGPTLSGVLTNFRSFIPKSNKRKVVYKAATWCIQANKLPPKKIFQPK